jgi:CubicO group peptidase (beta-lactamase class C family)
VVVEACGRGAEYPFREPHDPPDSLLRRCSRTALAAASIVVAATAAVPAAAQESRSTTLLDTAALTTFADDFFAREMAARRVPGAVLVVVHEARVVLSRGYGYADLESRRPVDPERTLFRIGSVSKLITATAAMQLVEQGRLELHRDVNDHLGRLRLEESFGTPISLHHLLTHTPGLEDRLTGIASLDPDGYRSLADGLAHGIPKRVRQPGVAISYSNHGTALVGLLIEEVTGVPFHEYVRRHVQEPIGMLGSGFRLSPALRRELATGYEIRGDRLRPIPLDYLWIEPAGNFAATGRDMARFLLAHLGDGAHDGGRILRPETVRLMHDRRFEHHPRIAAWAYGFYESRQGERRVLMHTGGWRDFRSVLFLLPDAGTGVFLSYNRADEGPLELQQAFMDSFLHRYFPESESESEPPLEPSSRSAGPAVFEGRYRYIRRSHTTAEKLLLLAYGDVRVRRVPGSGLSMAGLTEDPVRLTPAGEMLFLRDDGDGYVTFEALVGAKPQRLVTGAYFPIVLERIRWWESRPVQLAALATMALLFAATALRWPYAVVIRALRRRFRPSGTPAPGEAGRLAERTWRTVTVAAVLNLIVMIGFPIAFAGRMTGGMPHFVYGMPPLASALLVLPWIASGLTLVAVPLLVLLWRRRHVPLPERMHLAATLLALLLFIPFAVYWRLLAFGG